jgi:hypothetical protein
LAPGQTENPNWIVWDSYVSCVFIILINKKELKSENICVVFSATNQIEMALPVAVALSGLNKSSFSDDLNDIYDQGAVLLKSPSMTSVASTEGSTCSQESGISSMASEPSSQKSLTNYFDLLWETNQTQNGNNDSVLDDNTQASEIKDDPLAKETPLPQEIIHQNRNILNLASNMRENSTFFKPAQLKEGIVYFFNNRSQYSRVAGATIPDYVEMKCPREGCGYIEPHYDWRILLQWHIFCFCIICW